MMRAAIYARFSSDHQSEKSIDDQIALCREVCARERMAVVSTFEDRAISGSAAINRPGFQALMCAAEAKAFDVIIAEDMDRIFRDQGDYHAARKRLDFLGITIHTAAGKVGKLDGALRALMGEMFIENLVLHTRRGMDGVVRDGRHAGGRAYGYAAVPGKPGELVIVEAEADVVRRIFADYIDGRTPRDIAASLNAEGIKAARGPKWNASTINGNLQRGGGILLNDLYAGFIVWNKVRMVKDPASGKRISRPNPTDQHRTADAPHLRIVAEDVWQAAQRRKRAASNGTRHLAGPRETRILSGLIRCGACGGAMVSSGHRHGTARLQCSNYREAGTCANGRRVKRDDVEAKAFEGLRRAFAEPAYLAEYVATYNAERQRLAKSAGQERSRIEKRLAAIGRESERAVDAIVSGADTAELIPRINALAAERKDLTARLETIVAHDNVITLHPAAIERYRRDIARLADMLTRDETGAADDLADTIRRLVAEVVVDAPANSEKLEIEVRGRLAELVAAPALLKRSGGGGPMVAGEGLEPPTPGL